MDELTRRALLKRAAAGAALFGGIPALAAACGGDGEEAAGTTTGAATTAEPTGEPLKIGFFTTLTGPLALGGSELLKGWEFFVEDRNSQIGGRPLEVVVEDDEGDPQLALTKVRKLIQQDQVDILAGGLSAAVGPPVFELVNEVEIPWINAVIAPDDLTQRLADQNRFMIRTGQSASQPNHPFGEWVYDELGYRNVVTIGFDFLFGYQNVSGFQRTFQDKGGAVVQKIWTQLGTPDFSPFISQIDTDADAIFLAYSSADAIRFLQQATAAGLRERMPVIGQYTLTYEAVLRADGIRDEHVVDIVTPSRYSAVADLETTRDFVSRYIAAEGEVPPNNPADGYSVGLFIEAALEQTGGDTSDKGAFADAFVGLEIETPLGPTRIGEDRNSIGNVYIRRVERVEDPPVEGYNIPYANTVIQTYEDVDQYWTYDKEEFLSQPAYDRSFPPVQPRVES